MDSSRTPNSLYYRTKGVSPKKSPTTASVQKRRKDLERSEKAAYWALLNTFVALTLYYDLCYLKILEGFHILISYLGWFVCAIFTASACYDYLVHFWPHTFMKPIVVSPVEKKLLGIREDEFGFKVEELPPVKFEPIYDNLPPFEIHYSFEEDEKVVTPQKKPHTSSPDTSLNTSRRSNIVDRESLVEYLKSCQLHEEAMAELREADLKQSHNH